MAQVKVEFLKGSRLYRYMNYKLNHPQWQPLDQQVLLEAIMFHLRYPDTDFAILFENKIIEEIVLAITHLPPERSRELFLQLKKLIFSISGYPEAGENFVFRLKKAVVGALTAADRCLQR